MLSAWPECTQGACCSSTKKKTTADDTSHLCQLQSGGADALETNTQPFRLSFWKRADDARCSPFSHGRVVATGAGLRGRLGSYFSCFASLAKLCLSVLPATRYMCGVVLLFAITNSFRTFRSFWSFFCFRFGREVGGLPVRASVVVRCTDKSLPPQTATALLRLLALPGHAAHVSRQHSPSIPHQL